MESAQETLRVAKPCDIIEFDYSDKKHYAFYVEDGVCIHFVANEGSCCGSASAPLSSLLLLSSSSSPYQISSSSRLSTASSSVSSGNKYGFKVADRLMAIANGRKCRVNNFPRDSKMKGQRRSDYDAIYLALQGIPMDEDGDIIFGKRGDLVEYPLESSQYCKEYAWDLRYVNMESPQEVLKIAKPCDIIEFDRGVFNHYALYIGDGVCVHVVGPEAGDNDNLSLMSDDLPSLNLSSLVSAAVARSVNGTKTAQRLVDIAMRGNCRINNFEKEARIKKRQKRAEEEALSLALEHIPTGDNGKIVTEQRVPVEYQLLSGDNCEGYVTHWKFEGPGWSNQAEAVEQETRGILVGIVSAVLIGLFIRS